MFGRVTLRRYREPADPVVAVVWRERVLGRALTRAPVMTGGYRHMDITQLEAELATDGFDPVEYVNSVIPDSSGLCELARVTRDVENRTRKNTDAIREKVRTYSAIGTSGEAGQVLKSAKKSIDELAARIANIQEQARQTQEMVSRICSGIKPLDRAKVNLTANVTALRRLKMVLETVNALEKNVAENNYRQCADNVLALTSLFEFFKKYSEAPQVAPLQSKFFDLKRGLRNKVNTELESKLFRGSADETNLPLCAVIDAFADDFRSNTIDLFCDKFLGPYDDAYGASPLKDVQHRFQWFKQRIDFYNKQYQNAFPREWRIPYYLSLVFCRKTAAHLTRVMNENKPNVTVYLQAFELVVRFEQKMADSFAKTEIVYIDPDAPMPQFENTPEGVRKKVEWRMRKENGIGEQRKVPATEFIGAIASAFAPHMSLYLDSEKERLSKLVKDAFRNPTADVDDESKQMKSAVTLVVSMKAVIDKCARFNIPGSLLDLFMNLKVIIGQYVESLTRALPSKAKSDQDYRLLCAIANTSSLLLDIIDSLATKVRSLIEDANMSKGIVVDDTKEAISSELRKQLIYIVDVIAKELEPVLVQIGNNSWDPNSSENGKTPQRFGDIMNARFTVIQNFMTSDNLNRMRSTFTQRVVSIIHDSLFRMRQVTNEFSARVLIAVEEVRNIVTYCTKGDSTLAKKRIENEFRRLEVELKVLCSPEMAMSITYITMMQKRNKEHFKSIIKLRGYPPAKEAELLAEYDDQLSKQQAQL